MNYIDLKLILVLFSALIYNINCACVATAAPNLNKHGVHPLPESEEPVDGSCNSGYALSTKDNLCHPYSFACDSNPNPEFYLFENGTCTCDYLYNCNAPDMEFHADTCSCICTDNKYLDSTNGQCVTCLNGNCTFYYYKTEAFWSYEYCNNCFCGEGNGWNYMYQTCMPCPTPGTFLYAGYVYPQDCPQKTF